MQFGGFSVIRQIKLIRERGLNPADNCNLAKGMLAPFGIPKQLCPPQEAGLIGNVDENIREGN